MNKTHRLIWNSLRQTWTVAHEAAATQGKRSRSGPRLGALAAVLAGAVIAQTALAAPPAANALPTNGQVVTGQAVIAQADSTMTIRQASNQAILNWNTFNIGANAAVNFIQPGSSAVALNRVVGTDPSAIYGSLTANGQVFLINPNGVLFGQGARVDVGGLVASTLSIRNEDFLAGNYRFTRDGATAGVTNQGDLLGKYIALLAPEVRNEGVISARQGSVALAAGEAVTLGVAGNALIDVHVEKATIDTLVANQRLVQADDGTVILSARSANALLGRVVNTGAIEARGISNDGGTVRLLASSSVDHGGSINVDAGKVGTGGTAILLADLANPASKTTVGGTITARGGSESGDGGFIETSASKLKIADAARIDTSAPKGHTGQWLLDPYDFTIASGGGDITGAALSAALGSNNVTIQAGNASVSCTNATCGTGNSSGNGDIFVNDSVSWASNKSLTLNAWRHIEINAPISVNGAGGGLNLQFAQSDVAANIPFGNYLVHAPVNLAAGTWFTTQYGSVGATVNYTVIRDDAGLTTLSGALAGNYVIGTNFTTARTTPLGNFTGYLDGLGHAIDGLTITNAGANPSNVGFFNTIGTGALVQNLGLTGVTVAGLSNVGALAGTNDGLIYNVYSRGSVTGRDAVGANNNDSVGAIGGLIGRNDPSGLITNSYSSATVTATTGVQGTGAGVDGGIGGLVGVNNSGTIGDSYASGSVTGEMDVGGLVGFANGILQMSYSSGFVTGTTNVGGFLGQIGAGALLSTYWDADNSTQPNSAFTGPPFGTNSQPLTTAQAKQEANYSGFDFNTTWIMYDGVSYPLLRSMLTPFIVTADAKTKTYDTNTFPGGGGSFTTSYSMATPGAVNTAGLGFGGTATAGTDAGSYTITPNGVVLANDAAKQDQHGYRIVFADGTLTIDKATVTLSAATKTYDGTTTLGAGTFTVTGVAGQTLNYSGATASNAHVGGPDGNTGTADNFINLITLADNGAVLASNYLLPTLNVANAPVTITPRTVGLSATKTYDGTTALGAGTVTLNGVAGESLGYSGATSNNAHVATAGKFINAITLVNNGAVLASDYQLPVLNPANAPVTINPATLLYVADAQTMTSGADLPAFTGNVTGVAPTDTLAGVTVGSAVFSSTATKSDKAGFYAIDGSGLTLLTGSDYVLAQAASNANALIITSTTTNTNKVQTILQAARDGSCQPWNCDPEQLMKDLLKSTPPGSGSQFQTCS